MAAAAQHHRARLPARPGARRPGANGPVGIGQPRPKGGDEIAALGLGDRAEEILPAIGKQQARTALVEPVDLPLPAGEDAAQDHRRDTFGMRLGVGERQRRTPGAAEQQPGFRADHLAQLFEIGNEVPRGVRLQAAMRRRPAGAALVEEEDLVARGIEQPPVVRPRAAARPAVQEHRGLPLGIAAELPVEFVPVTDIEPAGLVGLDRRKGLAHGQARTAMVAWVMPLSLRIRRRVARHQASSLNPPRRKTAACRRARCRRGRSCRRRSRAFPGSRRR